VEPVHGFDGHLKCRRQVVPAARVMPLVQQDRVQLIAAQGLVEPTREQDGLAPEADDAWLHALAAHAPRLEHGDAVEADAELVTLDAKLDRAYAALIRS
jgi:hypothetical protein